MLKALLEKRAKIVADMQALIDLAEEADRDLSEDESAEYAAMKSQVDSLNARISRAEEIATTTSAMNASAGSAAGQSVPEPRQHPGHTADETPREFDSLGEFLVTVARRPDDQRLASMYQERSAGQRMDDGPSGGFAVPAQFIESVLRVPGQEGVFRARSRVIPAGSPPDSAVTIPALDQDNGTTGNTVRGGVKVTWIGEGASKPRTDTKLKLITLEPKEVAATMDVTDKLLRNWQAAGSFLEGLMREAVISAEEEAFFSGNGVAKPLGIINAPATLTVARGASGITYANLVAMLSKLLIRGGSPVWHLSQSEMPALLTLEDDEGHLIWQPNAREGLPTTLLGYPLIWNEFSPLADQNASVALCNHDYYLIKDGSGPFVAASEHVKFEENKTVFKVFFNVDGQPWLQSAFKQQKGYEVSPFVILGAA
jgi:HK97 family phage major capsid protein